MACVISARENVTERRTQPVKETYGSGVTLQFKMSGRFLSVLFQKTDSLSVHSLCVVLNTGSVVVF